MYKTVLRNKSPANLGLWLSSSLASIFPWPSCNQPRGFHLVRMSPPPTEDWITQAPLQLDVVTWLSSGQWDVSSSVRCLPPKRQLVLVSLSPLSCFLECWCCHLGPWGWGTQPREGQQCLSLVLVGLLPPSYHIYPVPTFRLHMRDRINLMSCISYCSSGFFSHS